MTDFSNKLIQILNHGALNLALGLGYSLKIFDVMDEIGEPATLEVLAEATGLDNRYLKEWLGIMVTGEIITLVATPQNKNSPGQNIPKQIILAKKGEEKDQEKERYYLPPAHADVLTRRAGNNNLGVYTQETPLLTLSAMEAVKKGFLTGEGVSFDHYPRFQAFMSELSNAKHEQVLIKDFLPSVEDGRLVEFLKQGIQVCDIGCGEGVALILMAKAFPNSQFLGLDNHETAIGVAKKAAQSMGLPNARFKISDAAQIQGDRQMFQRFDYVTAFDAIHDQSHPTKVLEGIRSMLKPGGLFSMVDIKASTLLANNLDHPMGPFFIYSKPNALHARGSQ